MSRSEELAAHAHEHGFAADVERGAWGIDVEADPVITTSLRLPKSSSDWLPQEAVVQHQRRRGLIRQGIEQRRAVGSLGGPDDTGTRLERLERLERAVLSTTEAPWESTPRSFPYRWAWSWAAGRSTTTWHRGPSVPAVVVQRGQRDGRRARSWCSGACATSIPVAPARRRTSS